MTISPALFRHLRGHDRLLEVGIGERDDLAVSLADRGHQVLAIDPAPEVDPDIPILREDVSELRASDIGPVDAVYARRLPPELQGPTVDLARGLEAACYFTTLGTDPPVVEVTLATGPMTTVYIAQSPESNSV